MHYFIVQLTYESRSRSKIKVRSRSQSEAALAEWPNFLGEVTGVWVGKAGQSARDHGGGRD